MTSQELDYLSKEQKLIEEIKSIIGTGFVGDDCAQLPGGLLVSSDSLIEGTHFRLETAKLADIGWKAMAVNLSDIAAMAGRPRYALVNMAVPPKLNQKQFLELYKGIAECAHLYRTAIVGGDITASQILMMSITIIGYVHENGCLTRSGAKLGDAIVVTGHFGAAATGLHLLNSKQAGRLRSNDFSTCLNQFLKPTPKLSESWDLAIKAGPRAALMDTSDGLADALAQIARASHVGMRIDLTEIPIHSETRKLAQELQVDPFDLALYGGEDFELVGCLPEEIWQNWLAKQPASEIPFKKIGQVTNSGTVELMMGNKPGAKLDLSKCFQHIAKDNQK